MRLTAKSEYGLLALVELAVAPQGKPVSSRTIAEKRGIPQPYLEQLFASLRREGLVSAVRGAHGGFVLAKPASEITILEIVETLEGQPLSSGVCSVADTGSGCAAGSSCVAAPVWTRATQVLRELFESMNLETLAEEQRALEQERLESITREAPTATRA